MKERAAISSDLVVNKDRDSLSKHFYFTSTCYRISKKNYFICLDYCRSNLNSFIQQEKLLIITE